MLSICRYLIQAVTKRNQNLCPNLLGQNFTNTYAHVAQWKSGCLKSIASEVRSLSRAPIGVSVGTQRPFARLAVGVRFSVTPPNYSGQSHRVCEDGC